MSDYDADQRPMRRLSVGIDRIGRLSLMESRQLTSELMEILGEDPPSDEVVASRQLIALRETIRGVRHHLAMLKRLNYTGPSDDRWYESWTGDSLGLEKGKRR